MHFADVPPSQAKYVTCLSGAVLDVVVDIRVGSPTFGQWEMVLLDDADRRAVYLVRGPGHAFMALEDRQRRPVPLLGAVRPGPRARRAPARPGARHRLADHRPGRPPLEPLLSDKDAQAPTLAEARRPGLLPSYDEALDYVASLRGPV